MDKKRTRGRQKIPIQRITNEADCFATFSKRRLGLYKKASEICTLCDVDIGIILFSPTGKPFSFFHPTMESVMSKFQHSNFEHNDVSRMSETYTRTRIRQYNHVFDKFNEQLEDEKKKAKMSAQNQAREAENWWEMPIADMNKQQVQELIGMYKNLKMQLKNHEEQLKGQASTSSGFFAQYIQSHVPTAEANPPLVSMMRFSPLPGNSSFHTSHGYYPYGQNRNGEGCSHQITGEGSSQNPNGDFAGNMSYNGQFNI